MRWVKISAAVLLTSAAMTVALLATGAVLVGNALASDIRAPGRAEATNGHNAPPELARLKDIPAAERFAHFKGIQINLTDRDGNPLDISIAPGVATSVTATSLTVAGNDGTSHIYMMNDQTFNRETVIATGDKVVVVTVDDSATARAVFSNNPQNTRHGKSS